MHREFEWDERKAESNLKKHGVTFEEAADVLGDEEWERFHLNRYDMKHSADEDRFITIGSHPDDRRIVLFLCWTERTRGARAVTSIINARNANPKERLRYVQSVRQK